MDRRGFVQLGAAATGLLLAGRAAAQAKGPATDGADRPAPAARLGKNGPVAVVTPNGATLPLRDKDGVRIGHLVAMPVQHSFAPGIDCEVWGYSGRAPGPTIECMLGDRLRIYVTNRLPEPTSVHWHGLIVPNGMDGVAGLTQKAIQPGETFMYEFEPDRAGTFMYHPHYDEMTQMALGMMGMIVVHPQNPRGPRVDRDFALMTHEWMLRPGAKRPDPNAMADFNLLTFNGKVFPATAPLVVGKGERVRVRFGNLSAMDHHPIHFHGVTIEMTGTDGGEVPLSARHPETTVLVPVGTTRTIELVANEPGDWAMHCHMTHHVMTQMGHGMGVTVGANARKIDERVQKLVPEYMTMGQTGMGEMAEMGMPVPKNSTPMAGGPGPFGYIDMGGMFTVLKVRDDPSKEPANGWYSHPKGTVATVATPDRMKSDGIDPGAKG
ncbi:MAG: copper oxidase [Polyangiaceae bacterium]